MQDYWVGCWAGAATTLFLQYIFKTDIGSTAFFMLIGLLLGQFVFSL